MTIACFNTNNLRGIDPYSRKVYYLDDPVHLLVSCAKLCNAMVLNTKFLGFMTGDYESCEKVLFTISRTRDYLVFKAHGYPSVTRESRHTELLSIQSQTKPPQSNSKFGVGRPQPNSKFGVELPYPNSKFGVGKSQQCSEHL